MRINVEDELAELAEWYSDDPVFVRGACWALARVAGVPADVLERKVLRPGSPLAVPAPVPTSSPTEPSPVAAPALVAPDPGPEVLGMYPGIGPITRLADPLTPADMTRPPAPPSGTSMAEAFAAGQAAGNPAVLPMDDATLAEIDAEIEAARARVAAPPAP